MMSWRRLVLLPAVLAGGCTALNPFATGPLPAGPNDHDPGPRVGVCFNPLKTPAEKLQALGQAQCFDKSVAEKIGVDYHLDDCPVLTPARATFVCKPTK
jgi:hypothetical protein